MTTTNKSISNNSIHFIQLKLFDFVDEKPNFDEILNKRLKQEFSLSKDYSLELDENNTFKYVNPECPKCGSHKILKKVQLPKKNKIYLEKLLNSKNNNINVKIVIKSSESRIKHCLMKINTLLNKYLIKYLK